jgi:general secretion pathway protein G
MLRLRERPDKPRDAGFTLIELLVVIVILGMLAAVAGPQAIKLLGGAKLDTARVQIRELGTILDVYRLDTGAYPTTSQGLQALYDRPPGLKRWNGPYVKHRDQISDPWGNPFQYRYPGQHGEYDLWSSGDGSEGQMQTANINNW